MSRDIRDILRQRNIFFRESGPNCAKGHIVIDCPFCIASGRGDTGQHLGIELSSGRWGCWRFESHRGRALPRLLQTLLRISRQEALRLLGIGESTIFSGDREFLDLFSADGQFIGFDLHEDVQDDRPPEYEMPEDVQPLDIDRMAHRPGVQYLVSRGFAYEELPELVALYDLHYAYSGDYSGRVVVPVYMHNKLVGVTGRAVFKASLRYKNSRKEEGPVNIYESLANFDSILEEDVPEALVVVEGPFDMIKVDFYGRKYGIRSTCLFTKHIGKQQEDFLYELISYSKKTIILLDDDAFAESLLYAGRLSHFGDRVSSLGFDPNKFQAEDAGALSPRGVAKLCREILGKLH